MIKEMLSDWKLWLFLVNIGGVILLKINDFKHVSKSLGEIKITLNDMKNVQIKNHQEYKEDSDQPHLPYNRDINASKEWLNHNAKNN